MVAGKLVLSVDGGGIRCIIAALMLSDLQRRLRASGRPGSIDQYMDMMTGSGIGALIVAALAYRSPIDKVGLLSDPAAITDYFHKGAALFLTMKPSASGQMLHDGTMFEEFLKSSFGEKTLVADASRPVVFPAFDIANRVPVIITDDDPVTSNFYLWQALRGMVAVPPFLSPALVENRAGKRARGTPLIPIISGGRYSEDPSLAAYVQARKFGWHDQGFSLLSLGSGADMSPISYFNTQVGAGMDMTDVTEDLLHYADDLHSPIASHMNMLMNGDARSFNGIATRPPAEHRSRLNYFRINGHLQTASLVKDDLSETNIEKLRLEAEKMIRDHGSVLDEIVNRLPPVPRTYGDTTTTPLPKQAQMPGGHGGHGGQGGISEATLMPTDTRSLPANWW